MVQYTGTYGPDLFLNTAENDTFLGGTAYDVASFYELNYRSGTFGRDEAGNLTFTHGGEVDTFQGFEQIDFIDGHLIIDASSPNAEVLRLYKAGLDRAPDQEGLNYWTDQRYQGESLHDLAQSFLDSPEYQTRFGGEEAGTGTFVTNLYENIFDRNPDAQGLQFWSNELDSGARDRADVLMYFSQSLENLSVAQETADGIWDRSETAAEVARLYDSAYNRLPDLPGLSGHVAAIDIDGGTLREVATSFLQSSEFTAIYGSNPTNADFVAELYANTLDRAGESEGLAFWQGQLDSGSMDRVDLLVAFSESPEHVALTAPVVGGETADQFGIAFA
jgi:hypothetical protein